MTNSAAVHPNTVVDTHPYQSDTVYVDGEFLHTTQNVLHYGSEGGSMIINATSGIATGMMGGDSHEMDEYNNLYIIPASPVNDPNHGKTVDYIPADSADTSIIPIFNAVKLHYATSAFHATYQQFETVKRRIEINSKH